MAAPDASSLPSLLLQQLGGGSMLDLQRALVGYGSQPGFEDDRLQGARSRLVMALSTPCLIT